MVPFTACRTQRSALRARALLLACAAAAMLALPPALADVPITAGGTLVTDRLCAMAARDVLAALVMESPDIASASCSSAGTGVICNTAGTAGPCASTPACDGLETVPGESCTSATLSSADSCCSVFEAKLCPTCDPEPLLCAQFCFDEPASRPPTPASRARTPPAPATPAPSSDRNAACAAIAADVFEIRVSDSPEFTVAGGCDAVNDSTSSVALCDIRGTAGPCDANPDCPTDQIENRGCTASNEESGCCFEELAKPCPDCAIIPTRCLSVCDGPPPPPRSVEDRTDAACTDLADIVLAQQAVDNPDLFTSAGCDEADPGKVCDISGDDGLCSGVPACDGLDVTGDASTSAACMNAESICCTVLQISACLDCSPVPGICVQTCLEEAAVEEHDEPVAPPSQTPPTQTAPTRTPPASASPPPQAPSNADKVCAAIAADAFNFRLENNPGSHVAGGCDAVDGSTSPFAVCDIRGTAGACDSNPDCPADQIQNDGCTAENEESGCCFEELTKPCPECATVPTRCLSVCDGPSPPPRSEEDRLDAICTDFADVILAELAAGDPELFTSAGCDEAEPGQVCDISGDDGLCSRVPVCDGVEVIGDDSTSDACMNAESICCSVLQVSVCPECAPEPRLCQQVCFEEALVADYDDDDATAPQPSIEFDATCDVIGTQALEELAMASPDSFTTAGCDAAEPFTICEVRGTGGACEDNPGCPPAQIKDSGNCAAANGPPLCCYETLAKACEDCPPIPLSCLNLCTRDGVGPPETPEEAQDRVCADVADVAASQLAVERPDTAASCMMAEPGQFCDFRGSGGPCSGEPDCAAVAVDSGDSCAADDAEPDCCTVVLSKPCDACEPAPVGCLQTCTGGTGGASPVATSTANLGSACRAAALENLELLAMEAPETYTTVGCDAADPLTICDIRGTAGACEDNPGCPPVQIDDSANCTASDEPPVCCFESVAKACDDCEPIPLQCLNVCIAAVELMELPQEEILDRRCADAADLRASLFAAESPMLISENCSVAEPNMACDLRGSAGACTGVPECAGVDVSSADGCAVEGAEIACCDVVFAKGCEDCAPEAVLCVQTCFASDMDAPGSGGYGELEG